MRSLCGPCIRFREVDGLGGVIRTAIVASAQQQLCCTFAQLLPAQGIELLACAPTGQDALHLLPTLCPDLLICDAQLPGLDGATLAYRVLCMFSVPVRPAVLLLHYPEYPLPHTLPLQQAGALFLEKPVQDDVLAEALNRLQSTPPKFSDVQLQRADALLDALGVPEHSGRTCLKYAALLCAADGRRLHNLSRKLYPLLEQICPIGGKQAERAMRHVIGLAWQSDKFDNQYRIFADTVDAGRGQPTCSEMISRLADILRLEG